MTTPEGKSTCNCYKCYLIRQTAQYLLDNPEFTTAELIAGLGASLIEILESSYESKPLSADILEQLFDRLRRYAARPEGASLDLAAVRAANCEEN